MANNEAFRTRFLEVMTSHVLSMMNDLCAVGHEFEVSPTTCLRLTGLRMVSEGQGMVATADGLSQNEAIQLGTNAGMEAWDESKTRTSQRNRPTMIDVPTPWTVKQFEDDGEMKSSQFVRVYGPKPSQWVADCGMSEANAAFICRACNSHDELLEIAKAIVWTDENSLAGYRFKAEFVSTVRAAISKATGESQ